MDKSNSLHIAFISIGAVLVSVAVGAIAFPFVAAGTLDPCEAAARVVVRKSMGGPPDTPLEASSAILATRQATDMLREDGTLKCYYYLAKAVRAPEDEFRKRAGR